MRRPVIFLVALFAPVLCNAAGCTIFQTPQTHQEVLPNGFNRRYSPAELKEDIDFLVRTLEAVHPDLYAYTPRDIIARERNKIESRLTTPLSRVDFYLLVAPLVARFQDGHTKIYPVYEEYFDYVGKGGLLLPVEVGLRGGKTVVAANYSSEEQLVPRSELLGINDVPTAAIIERLLPLVSGQRLPMRLGYLETFYRQMLWLAYRFDGQFCLEFISMTDGRRYERTVDGITYSAMQARKRQGGEQELPYSYRLLPEKKIGILRVEVFADPEPFSTFLGKTFTRVKHEGVSDLIIDLRDNGGGYSIAALELARYLTDKPVVTVPKMDIKVSAQIKGYYRSALHPYLGWFAMQWFHPTWRRIWKATGGATVTVAARPERMKYTPLRFFGSTYVLIGANTFSTATEFAAMVKDYGLGVLVGEETGGLATSFGDFYPFDLPNSRLLVRVSHKRIFRPSGKDDGRGVVPDHEVGGSTVDRARGVDSVMEYTMRLIQSRHGAAPR